MPPGKASFIWEGKPIDSSAAILLDSRGRSHETGGVGGVWAQSPRGALEFGLWHTMIILGVLGWTWHSCSAQFRTCNTCALYSCKQARVLWWSLQLKLRLVDGFSQIETGETFGKYLLGDWNHETVCLPRPCPLGSFKQDEGPPSVCRRLPSHGWQWEIGLF